MPPCTIDSIGEKRARNGEVIGFKMPVLERIKRIKEARINITKK